MLEAKRRFAKIKRRFTRTKRRFILLKRRFALCLICNRLRKSPNAVLTFRLAFDIVAFQ